MWNGLAVIGREVGIAHAVPLRICPELTGIDITCSIHLGHIYILCRYTLR